MSSITIILSKYIQITNVTLCKILRIKQHSSTSNMDTNCWPNALGKRLSRWLYKNLSCQIVTQLVHIFKYLSQINNIQFKMQDFLLLLDAKNYWMQIVYNFYSIITVSQIILSQVVLWLQNKSIYCNNTLTVINYLHLVILNKSTLLYSISTSVNNE